MTKVTFRALTEEDILEKAERQVAHTGDKSTFETMNFIRDIKDYRGVDVLENDKTVINMLNDNIRQYISLPTRVLNYNLSGPQLEHLKNITGYSDLPSLMNLTKVLDRETLAIVDVTEDMYDEVAESIQEFPYIVGAEAIYRLIDEFDLNERIKSYLMENVIRQMYKNNKVRISSTTGIPGKLMNSNHTNYVPRTPSDGLIELRIAKGWVYQLPESIHRFTQEDMDKALKEEYDRTSSTLSLLLNINPDLSGLRSMFTQHVIVTPMGLHPSKDGRVDVFVSKLVKLLNIVDKFNIFLKSNRVTLTDLISQKARLQTSVNELIFKSAKDKPTDVSYAEKIKGKHGFIRDKLLGKRTDYSGRSIITINPTLSIDECALPAKIIAKCYRYHHIKALIGVKTIHQILKMSAEDAADEIEELGILERVPAMLNRAPSLHKLSFLGFKVKRSMTNAIEIGPLVTTGFNADFDGDAMGVHVPLSDEAIKEVLDFMLPSKNIRHPANGKPILVPKMEMVYGLNQAAKEHTGKGEHIGSFNDYLEVYNLVCKHKIKVYDTITFQGKERQAGQVAFDHCLPEYLRGRNEVITSKTITKYTDMLIDHEDTEGYRKYVDALVDFGFKLAKIYTPSINILDDYNDPIITDPLKDFYGSMEEVFELYQLGLESEEKYLSDFTDRLSDVMKSIEGRLIEVLGEDNGFLQLILAGARGSLNNAMQIYSIKGQIKKSDHEDFPAVIGRGFIDQLYPLQHFISAYGTRKGLTDRTQKTGDTGYLGRLLYHAGSDYVIHEGFCGATEGLKISKHQLRNFIKDESEDKRRENIANVFTNAIVNRYNVANGQLITEEQALKYAEDPSIDTIEIFSPINCRKPCCQRCYGFMPRTMEFAKPGTAIGFIAGQAIGEPGTQLTMRTFQKGGVAGKKDVTSDFDRINKFIKLSSFQSLSTYDPIAWDTGKIEVTEESYKTKTIRIDGENNMRKTIVIDKDAILKDEVKVGDNMCILPGDQDIKDLLKYKGFDEAQTYLFLALYTCYLGQAEIAMIHFEVLVASMSLYGVLRTNSPNMKVGQLYTAQRYWEERNKGYDIEAFRTIKSVQKLPLYKDSPLSNIVLENVGVGISKAVLFELSDNLDTNMGLMLLGKRPNLGTNYQPK